MPLRLARAFFPLLLIGLGSATAAETPIEWQKSVTLRVGQAAIVHSARGECGKPPAKAMLKPKQYKTGHTSFGKLGVRESRRCGGLTPAVEVIFNATTPGKETIEVDGDKIKVTVKP